MNKNDDPRVLEFVEYVRETQPVEVANEFLRLLAGCEDPVNANLTMILEKAKVSSPNSAERFKLERNLLRGIFHHCNT